MQPDPELIPDEKRLVLNSPPEPVFWIKEIRLLNRFEPGEDAEIRRIPLHHGLNIIWAKPSDPDEPDPAARGRGHDVGKSTFCRLIRDLLGEPRFGTEATRRALAATDKLDHPWVLGEIIVSGETWSVARPLYSGGHPFAMRNTHMDDALVSAPSDRLKHEDFVAHLQGEVLKNFPVQSFDTKNERPIRWLHLLQWLARDQEAHLSSPFKWRDPSSNSESPDLTAPDALYLVRCVFGVTDADERKIITKRETLNSQKNTLTADIRFHERRVLEALERARNELPDGDKLPDIAEELFVDQVVRHAEYLIEARRLTLESQIEELDLPTLERSLETAIGQTAIAQDQFDAVQQQVTESEDQWKRMDTKPIPPTVAELQEILAKLPPDRHHCEVPTNIALFQCPILRAHRNNNGEPKPEPQGIEAQTAHLREEISRTLEKSRKDLDVLALRLKSAKENETAARSARKTCKDQVDKLTKDVAKLNPEVVAWQLRAEDARKSYQGLDDSRKAIVTIESKTDALKVEQDSAQKASKTRRQNLKKLFLNLSQKLKGPDVDAELKFTRDEIQARIGSGGGAYNALSALVFDYTALQARLHHIGHHPGFLIHDSPRESDMEPSLYRPLFHLLKQIADSAPTSFQYIVTTTEAPPEDLLADHVALPLDASSAEGFLFRTAF